MRTVTIGAPSLTGKDANDVVREAFETAKFPLVVKVVNHMPRQVVFPVVGLFLAHVCEEEKNVATVTVASYDQLQTFTTDVEQIAELNRYETALTVEEVEKTEKPKGKAKVPEKTVPESSAPAEPAAQADETKPADNAEAAGENQQPAS